MMRLLVLGGTAEANALAALVSRYSSIDAILSYAGRTLAPKTPPIACRIGGFGGVDGLVTYLKTEKIDLLVDATHPFAETMSDHAKEASEIAQVPRLCLSRPEWQAESGDRWIKVESMEAAAKAIGAEPKKVFLTIGRLQLAAFAAEPRHFYLIRSIDPIEPPWFLPNHQIILGRGPFTIAEEETILRRERIETVVTKNSGGHPTFAKIVAARRLGLEVVMVERKPSVQGQCVFSVNEAMDLILAHQAGLALRGV